MMAVKVWYVDARAPSFRDYWMPKESLVEKTAQLFSAAGLNHVFSEGDKVAIKIHLGEYGTTRYLRPVFIRKLVDLVRAAGGDPYITETTGLGIIPTRVTMKDYLEIATRHGFTEATLAAPVVVADGVLGFDGEQVEVDGTQLEEVWVARGILEADAILVVSHVKGHIQAGFGGALKNLGVGCVTKTSKYSLHFAAPPQIRLDQCNDCGECVEICPLKAIKREDEGPVLNYGRCLLCNWCTESCPQKAIKAKENSSVDITTRLIDLAHAVHKTVGSENIGYISYLLDIMAHCDCHPHADVPIVPDQGILAAKDPVAIDKAAIDIINQAPGILGSPAEEHDAMKPGTDKFRKVLPWTDYRIQLKEAEKQGLGTAKYELAKL